MQIPNTMYFLRKPTSKGCLAMVFEESNKKPQWWRKTHNTWFPKVQRLSTTLKKSKEYSKRLCEIVLKINQFLSHRGWEAKYSDLRCLGEGFVLVTLICFLLTASSKLLFLSLCLAEKGGSVRVKVKVYFTWKGRRKKDPPPFLHRVFILSVLLTPVPMIFIFSNTTVSFPVSFTFAISISSHLRVLSYSMWALLIKLRNRSHMNMLKTIKQFRFKIHEVSP